MSAGHDPVTALPAIDRLRGMSVLDSTGERVGRVEDVYVDEEDANARYLGLQTGWLGSKLVVVPVDEVRLQGAADIVIPYTRAELEAAPRYEAEDELTIAREEEIYGHYGRAPYWDIVRDRQRTPAPTPEIAEAEAAAGAPEAVGADEETDLAARQTEPAPTPEIAEAEVADAIRRGDDPNAVRVKRWGV